MNYGYARVSSKGQARDGTSLEDQERKLRDKGAVVIYQEAYTGTKVSRPQLDKLLAQLEPGDTLMVTKLDRLARSAQQGLEIIDQLLSAGVEVYILNMGILNNTPIGKLMRAMMLAFAEFERDIIVERFEDGKAIARENPEYREGRKPVEVDEALLDELKVKVTAGECSKSQAALQLGVSRATLRKLIA